MNHNSSSVQLAQALRTRAAGLAPGTRLPSSRNLTAEFGVSPVTVAAAVAMLVADGTLVTERGRGTFTAESRHVRAADCGWQTAALPEPLVDVSPLEALSPGAVEPLKVLNAGYLAPDLQPRTALAAAGARAMRRPHAWGRTPLAGLPELRSLFAAPLGLSPADVLLVPGAQAALALVFRALAPRSGTVLFEEPSYPGAVVAARAAGLTVVPVAGDADGLIPQALEQALTETGSTLVYAQTCVANPAGSTWAADRRTAVTDLLARAGAFLVEDDYARDLVFDGHPPRPLAAQDEDGHVVYLRSLTKAAAPSLRVAAVVARGPARTRIRDLRSTEDFFVARPMQEVAVELLGSPAWPRHLQHLHRGLRARRAALLGALARTLPTVGVPRVPIGGLHVWARLPPGLDSTAIARDALAAGVAVGDGRAFFSGASSGAHLRLSFGACGVDDLLEAVDLLARVLPD